MSKLNKKHLVLTTVASIVCATQIHAAQANIRIDGTIPGYVTPTSSKMSASVSKPISFQKIVLSANAKKWLAQNADKSNMMQGDTDPATLPKQVQLGMNNVPVLDQGRHGTCVTFATSAVLDAAIGSEDYISQLCSLELGSTLEKKDPNYPSGWDGSWGDLVLGQMKQYGIINMTSQRTEGCAGVYEYPRDEGNNHGKPMSVEDYSKRSEDVMKNIDFKTIATHDDAFTDNSNPNMVLRKVKTALNNGHRVEFGTLLDVRLGHNGAIGTYKTKNDTWMVTADVRKDAREGTIEAGHEMVITGYDDNAVVTGPNHEKQVGVLTLRNSWSEYAGDHGNYYMTYAHFKLLSMESYAIVKK